MMPNSPPASAEQELLALWECATARRPLDRDDALLATAFGGEVPRSLSQRHARLLALRQRLFGRALALRSNCPHCAATAEFAVDCAALQPALNPSPESAQAQTVEHAGWHARFRNPDALDLRAAASTAPRDDPAALARALLQRCLLQCQSPDGSVQAVDALPVELADAMSQAMDAAEPGAALGFDLVCPDCRTAWSAPLDPGGALWTELRQRAESLLLDIDALARAYGWTEPQVLALSPTRRAAYLQLVAHDE